MWLGFEFDMVALVPREGFEPPTYCLEGTLTAQRAAYEFDSSELHYLDRWYALLASACSVGRVQGAMSGSTGWPRAWP